MKNIKLTKPLAVFDLETTGINVDHDRIVQIAIIRVEPDGTQTTYETLVNPGIPIPAGASAVHGIFDKDVADQPTFAELLDTISKHFAGADLAGFNSIRFDLPLLQAEMKRSGDKTGLQGARHIDAMRIFHKNEKRDLTAAFRFYCDQELENAHSALADTEATLAILDAQLGRYTDLPQGVDELHTYCNPDEGKYVDRSRKLIWNDKGEAEFTFGKLKGQSLQAAVADASGRGYLEWMLGKDFNEDVKALLKDALGGVFPKREA